MSTLRPVEPTAETSTTAERACPSADFMAALEILYMDAAGLRYWVRAHYQVQPEDAEDAVQEAYTKAIERFDQYDQGRPLKNWIAMIAINSIRDVIKSFAHNREVTLEHPAMYNNSFSFPYSQDPGKIAEQREALGKMFATFSPLEFKVLVMYYFDGMGYQEIGQRLGGMHEEKLKSLAFRALRKARAAYPSTF